jgi:hypothetical protein
MIARPLALSLVLLSALGPLAGQQASLPELGLTVTAPALRARPDGPGR